MTNITTKETDKHVTVDIVGHAGYAEQGKDIVCAGVSTLAYTLINNLDRENGGIKYSIKDGSQIWRKFPIRNFGRCFAGRYGKNQRYHRTGRPGCI